MSMELIHTSVQRGIRGDNGFATACATRGLPPQLESVLAELSSYDFDTSRSVGGDVVEWAHRIVKSGSKAHTILSRVAPCGSDWSGRPNRVAHHLVVEASERAPAGPAWALSAFAGFATAVPVVEERASGPVIPSASCGPRRPAAWESAGFDGGWAGIVACTLLDHPSSTCFVVLPDEMDCLGLVSDVLALIPEERRWFITFSTRPQRMPASVTCQLRFVRAGASGINRILGEPGARRIVVARGQSPEPSAAVDAARAGETVQPSIQRPVRTYVAPVVRNTPQVQDAPPRPAAAPPKVGRSMQRASATAAGTASPAVSMSYPGVDSSGAVHAAPRSSGAPIGGLRTDIPGVPALAWGLFIYSAVAVLIAFVLGILSLL